ncbi:MAG: thiol:disulfide interchange protein [Bacteroidetes bacterium]|nr:MAG: thiol:disulfide interchange protein [Bacteroidota bacterium]
MNSTLLKSFVLAFSFLILSSGIKAQGLAGLSTNEVVDPVSWTQESKKISDNEYLLIFKATADEHWHFYSQYTEGTMPMAFYFDDIEGYKLVGKVSESPKPKEEYDDLLGGLTKYWDKTATFKQKVKITSANEADIHGAIEFQACIDGACTMLTYNFKFKLASIAEKTQVEEAKPVPDIDNKTHAGEVENDTTSAITTSAESTNKTEVTIDEDEWKKMLWEPITEQLSQYGNANSITDKTFIFIFILGFIGGLIALMTPCVWPMIPMTVSFFIKKKESGKRDAIIYGLSIVVVYVALGLGVTAIFGADALNAMATSAVFNIIFFVVLLIFAASFLGAFEIQLPTKWTNKMDEKADTTSGLISIFFMAFTLVLVSFSCTGPIIGTLLVESVTKGMWGPAIGMTGFAIALAMPFTLFAIFPSMMKSMPKSGGWLNSVKVVLGFLELALALKFLSVADMAYHWGILDREVFLVLWIVIFALLGIYLLGKLTFSHDSKVEKISVTRLSLAIISLSFALYMVPGLWGAPLKAISAFSPPQVTQDFDLYDGTVHAKFDNYEEGMAYAKKHEMPVLVDFTGWGCVNCRNMEYSVWSDPQVKDMLENEYVLISLYVDDKTPLPEEDIHISTFSGNKIRNIGNLWSDLQMGKFGQSSQPYYFPMDYDGKPLTGPSSYDLDIEKYRKFLKKGINEFKKRHKK